MVKAKSIQAKSTRSTLKKDDLIVFQSQNLIKIRLKYLHIVEKINVLFYSVLPSGEIQVGKPLL